MEFVEAWDYLKNHNAFNDSKEDHGTTLCSCFVVYVYNINPFTGKRAFSDSDAVEPRVALDVLIPLKKNDVFTGKKFLAEDLNVDGESFEDCIINLAELFKKNDNVCEDWISSII